MGWRRAQAVAAVLLACFSTLVAASPRRSDLDLYRDSLYLAGGLTCYPVGPRGEALQRAAERLDDRRRAVADALRMRLGQGTVDAIENEVQNSLDNIDYVGCNLDQAAEGRRQLGRNLRALERRVGLQRPSD